LIEYTTVEQEEKPTLGKSSYISKNLPEFRSKNRSPITNLSGDICFEQDQNNLIATLDLEESEEKDILHKTFSLFIDADKDIAQALSTGKVCRQRLRYFNCPVSEVIYSHNGTEYSIFVNRSSKIVEDLSGPIAQESGNLSEKSKLFLSEKKYIDAFIAHQKAKTLVSNRGWEISLRKSLIEVVEFLWPWIFKFIKIFWYFSYTWPKNLISKFIIRPNQDNACSSPCETSVDHQGSSNSYHSPNPLPTPPSASEPPAC
jgi:hypothetical protein